MKVQACPFCGARYDVERLEAGITFECRRCAGLVTVGESASRPGTFSIALFLSGLASLGALFLLANPAFDLGYDAWPWDLVRGEVALATRILVLAWFVAGFWALVSSLGIAAETRSLSILGLAGLLIVVCTAPGGAPVDAGHFAVTTTTWLHLLGMIGVAAGLLVHARDGESLAGRATALGGGLVVLGTFLLVFESGGTNLLRSMGATVFGWFDGLPPDESWHAIVGNWALLVAGLTGLLVGMGMKGRALPWIGVTALLVNLLLPTVAAFVGEFGDEAFWEALGPAAAGYGREALVANGLALWWLGTAAVSDLVRAGKDDA